MSRYSRGATRTARTSTRACAARSSSGSPPSELYEPGPLAAGSADVRLAVELGVELRAEEEGKRRVVQPEQKDHAARERPIGPRVVPGVCDVHGEETGQEQPEQPADDRYGRHPFPAPLFLVRPEVVHKAAEKQDRAERDWPAGDAPHPLKRAAEAGLLRDRVAERAPDHDQEEDAGGRDPAGEDEDDRSGSRLSERSCLGAFVRTVDG